MASDLTEKQRNILEFIVDSVEEQGSPPTIREIADRFGFSAPASAKRHLEALEKKGYIRRREWTARGIELVKDRVRKIFWRREGIPLIGRVAAGQPIVAEENIEDVLPLEGVFPSDEDLFALRVQGDSMIEAGILDGDIVIVRPQSTANPGDIVAAILEDEGEGTVKRLSYADARIVLEPANENYRPIVSDNVRIVGLVVGLMRYLRAPGVRVYPR